MDDVENIAMEPDVDTERPVSPSSFVIEFGLSKKTTSASDLQDAFMKYRKKRQKDIKQGKKRSCKKNEARLRALADPNRMWALRMKFVDQLKKYFGVPYAKRYWKSDEPEYMSHIFLDCCGLVRRAMRDLRKDFGFKLGPWNQGYMYDTLPITVEREQDMKPGDLVFIEAQYYNKKMKKQKHDITHVEIWLGDGPKTIGSRWHRGHVQVFDSYAFEAKSYHSERYIFKSIDTWLMGICRSHCREHQWKLRTENFKPAKKSVFSQATEQEKKMAEEERASDSENKREPLSEQTDNVDRPLRTPRSIGLDIEEEQEEDSESTDQSDDDSVTTASTASIASSTASTTTTSGTSYTGSTLYSTSSMATSTATGDSSSLRSTESDQSLTTTASRDSVSEISSISSSTNKNQQGKNLQKDFATLENPREGKESDSTNKNKSQKYALSYSVGESPRLSSPYNQSNTSLSGQNIALKPKPEFFLPNLSPSVVFDQSQKRWVPADDIIVQYGDDSDEECASAGSDDEDDELCQNSESPKLSHQSNTADTNKTTASIECQTGHECGTRNQMLGADKWSNPTNMLCYASMCNIGQGGILRGEAAVQVKSPDVLSVSTASSSSSEEGGYMPQDEASSLDQECLADIPGSAAEFNAQRMRQIHQSESSPPSLFQQDIMTSPMMSSKVPSRPGSASSMLARVGSAGAFKAPALNTLYGNSSSDTSPATDTLQESVISSGNESGGNNREQTTGGSVSDNESSTSSSDVIGHKKEQQTNKSKVMQERTVKSTDESGDCQVRDVVSGTSEAARDGDDTTGVHSPTSPGNNDNESGSESQQASPRKNKRAGGRQKKRDENEGPGRPPPPGSLKARMTALAAPKDPTFFIAGANGTSLVESSLTEIGWKRITNKFDDNFKLKWVENKSAINYNHIKGEKLVNRIPNCSLLTNKLGLLNSIARYERVGQLLAGSDQRFSSRDFLPETYRVDEPSDRYTFFETFKDGEIWICKPCGLNQGKGIFLVRELDEFQKALDERDEKTKATASTRPMERIVQRYIEKPLLLDNRKFDIRAFMLIASTTPYLVCYHPGYCRLCLYPYSQRASNLTAHLTNQFVQKKDSSYQQYKEETVWSMARFNAFINETVAPIHGLEQDWVYNTLTTRMKQIMTYIFTAVKHKLKRKRGYFDLYGLDFMVDSDMKIYLIEVNANPCLATNCEVLKEVIPGVVRESLFLAIECFEKTKRGQPLQPLHCLTNFQMLHCGALVPTPRPPSPRRASLAPSTVGTASTVPPRRNRSMSPVRQRSRSLSPEKESMMTSSSARTNEDRFPVLSYPAPPVMVPISTKTANSVMTPVSMPNQLAATTEPPPTTPRRPTSTTPRIVTLPPAPSAPTTPRHGLRGALPSLDRHGAVAVQVNDNLNQDMYKFKMTHAALMSSIKADQVQRKWLPERKKSANLTKLKSADTNRTMSQSLSEDDFSRPVPNVLTHSASSHVIGGGGATDVTSSKPEITGNSRSVHSSQSSPQLGLNPIAVFPPAKLAPRPSNGVSMVASTSAILTGRQIVPGSSGGGGTTQRQAASLNTIPNLRHGRPSNTDETIVGISLKRNERGS